MRKILIIAAIWLFIAGMCMAGEKIDEMAAQKSDLAKSQELLMWKTRAMQCETAAEMQKMQGEFKANQAKLKDLEAKEKKEPAVKK